MIAAVAVLAMPQPAIASSSCATAPGGGLTLTNVAAHNGRLVAVGSNGLVATSTGGWRWQVRPTGVQHDLRGVVWTGSSWVAIGDGGTIVRSLDRAGDRWARVSGVPNASLRAIAAKRGVIAAGGSNGTVLISTDDGGTWRAEASGTTSTLWGGASADGTLYLVGQAATIVASSDGVHWRRVAAAPKATGNPASPRPFLWQMAIGDGHRITVGDFGAILASGIARGFKGVRSPTREILRGAVYDRGRFVVVGSGGVVLRWSGSRLGWRRGQAATAVDLRGVAWTGRLFVAVGDEGTVVVSSDGLRWRPAQSAMPCALLGVARGARRLVAVGGHGMIRISDDGQRWRSMSRPTNEDLYAVVHGRGGFVAVGTHGVVLRSTDGQRWRRDRHATSLNLHAITWTGREYLAGGDLGTMLASREGRRWTVVNFPGYHAVRAFASRGGMIVAAGSGTVALRSPGGHWSLQSIGFQHFWTGVAYGAGRFVIVGHNGTALVSSDGGASWTSVTTGIAVNLDAVAWTGTEFLATGAGTAVASADGATWSPVRIVTRRSVRALVPDGRSVIGVGDEGAALQISV